MRKKIKNFLALALTASLCLSLCSPSFASASDARTSDEQIINEIADDSSASVNPDLDFDIDGEHDESDSVPSGEEAGPDDSETQTPGVGEDSPSNQGSASDEQGNSGANNQDSADGTDTVGSETDDEQTSNSGSDVQDPTVSGGTTEAPETPSDGEPTVPEEPVQPEQPFAEYVLSIRHMLSGDIVGALEPLQFRLSGDGVTVAENPVTVYGENTIEFALEFVSAGIYPIQVSCITPNSEVCNTDERVYTASLTVSEDGAVSVSESQFFFDGILEGPHSGFVTTYKTRGVEDSVDDNQTSEIPADGVPSNPIEVEPNPSEDAPFAEYTLSVPHTPFGNKAGNSSTVQFKLAGNGVTVKENPVSVLGTNDVVFNLSFTEAGTYPIQIYCVTTSTERCLTDERIYTTTLTVSDSGSVTASAGKFVLNGKDTGVQGSFVTRYRMDSVWSAETVARAKEIMADMTLEEKVGQLFLIHYPGDGGGTVTEAKTAINKYHPGGLLVFAKMFSGQTPKGVQNKTLEAQYDSLRDTGIPVLFAVDEEGGKVNRISQFTAFRSKPFGYPQDVAASGVDAVKQDAIEKAELLDSVGMSWNLAPVADVSGPSGYIYPRTYGADALYNAKNVAISVEWQEKSGMGTALKHFPGYGGTSSNTHNGFAINTFSSADFEYGDLLPFYAGMGAGGKGVLVTHNIINAWDTENPASLSSATFSYLRNTMGFDGLVTTDDLNMAAITTAVGDGKASLAALEAGVDMPMTAQPEKDLPVVMSAVKSGAFPMSRVEESCLRVLCWKIDKGLFEKYKLPDNPDIPPVTEEKEAEWTSADGKTVEYGDFETMWAKVTAKGGTIKLLSNVNTPGDKIVPARNITLNLNGHNLNFLSGTNGFIIEGTSSSMFTITDRVEPIVTSERNPSHIEEAAWNDVRNELIYYTTDEDGVLTRHNVDMDICGSITGSNTGIMIEVASGQFTLDGGVLTHKVRALEAAKVTGAPNYNCVINITGGAIMGCGVAAGGSTVNGSGIGLFKPGTVLNMSGGYIGGNSAKTRGAAIYAEANANATFNMTGGVIAANSIGTNGGAIYLNSNNTFNMSGGVMANNKSGSNGGAIYGLNSTVHISEDALITNNASSNGGAVFLYGAGSSMNMSGGMMTANEASNSGGAISMGVTTASGGTLNISGGEFAYNASNGSGGAIHAHAVSSSSVVKGVNIHDNSAATNGGGIAITGASYLVLNDLTISANDAGIAGGGVYHDGTSLMLSGMVRVSGNRVDGESNNLYLPYGKTVRLSNALDGNSLIRIYTEIPPEVDAPVDVVTAQNDAHLSGSIPMFRLDRVDSHTEILNGKIVSSVGPGSSSGTGIEFSNILFQHYSIFEKPSDTGDATRRLEMVDTSGKNLPKNGVSPSVKYLHLNADGSVKMDSSYTEIYTAEDITVENLCPIEEMNKFANANSNYTPTEVWVASTGEYAASNERDDWKIYPWSSNLTLTTDVSQIGKNDIYVETGSVVRFVGEPSVGSYDASAVFYDYDISDGQIYETLADAQAQANGIKTSLQGSRDAAKKTSYANTYKTGINSLDNYDDSSKAHLAFGNVNGQTGWGSQTVDGYSINGANRGTNHFKFCNFGIVTGLDSNGHIIYNPQITAPKLFDDGSAIGKTMIAGHKLGFVQNGDSYTLDSVSGTSRSGMSKFGHPGIYDGVQHKTCLWTNNFSPLDELGTFGTDGHDFKFGSTGSINAYRKFINQDTKVEVATPSSDDGTDHNSYFGMQFAVEFTVEENYVGPMEYYFFGNDDMWVFLDGQLVSDIGGVHSAAGSYVNLRDYIPEGSAGTHEMKFYYTERGASGFTCWMHLNVPNMCDITNKVTEYPGTLKILNAVQSTPTDYAFNYTVFLSTPNNSVEVLDEEFTYTGSKSGTMVSGDEITLSQGEYIIIHDIPVGTEYVVEQAPIGGFETSSSGTSGTMGSGQAIASFVNTWLYSTATGVLRISKSVLSSFEDGGEEEAVPEEVSNLEEGVTDEPVEEVEFPFQITFLGADDQALTDAFEYTGTKTGQIRSGDIIYLGDSDYIDILNIPDGTKYTVEELETEGYTLNSSTNTTGVIHGGAPIHAAFVNEQIQPPTILDSILPKTGGEGTTSWYLSGMLMLCAVFFAEATRRKKLKDATA